MNIKRWIIHPILFSIYPVLFYYSFNIGQVRFENVVEPLTFTVLTAIGGWGFLKLIFKDWFRSGGVASILIVLFYSYGHAKTNIDIAGVDYFLPVIWVVFLLVGIFTIIKSRDNFINGTKILNVVSAALVIIVATNIGSYQFKMAGGSEQNSKESIPQSLTNNEDQPLHPDIYFIILDAYGRQDVLKDIYNFDNSEFLGSLKNKGFYIADEAIANYGQTGLSLASSLNFFYLDEIVEIIGENSLSREPMNVIINENRALSFLKKQGYKVIAFASTRPETQMPSADVFLSSGTTLNEFHEGLKNTTPLPDMRSSDQGKDPFARYRMHTMFTLEKLGKIALEYKEQKFIFAHVGLPHPPFVFSPDGKPVQLESRFNDHDGNMLIRSGRLTVEEYRKYYRDQLVFLNKQMEHVVDEILTNSEQPPIVMIFGDHGPRSKLNWESAEKTDMRESLSILNAYHLPGNGKESLYPGISPVNSFRVIFNHYFGTKIDLLPDRSFYSTARYLYKFQEVTDKVRMPSKELTNE